MGKPEIYLSNWSSHRTPGHHGPSGRKFTIMARPRAWERGDGHVPPLLPNGPFEQLMAAAVAERKAGDETTAMEAYRSAFRDHLGACTDLAPLRLLALTTRDIEGYAPAERAIAEKELAKLRAKYPHGKPSTSSESDWVESPFTGGGFRWGAWTPPPESAEFRQAREEKERKKEAQRHKQESARQRSNIENVPDWRSVEALHELYRCDREWTEDERRRFKDLASPQRREESPNFAMLAKRLSVLHGQLLDDYAQKQISGIYYSLSKGKIATGHLAWLNARGV